MRSPGPDDAGNPGEEAGDPINLLKSLLPIPIRMVNPMPCEDGNVDPDCDSLIPPPHYILAELLDLHARPLKPGFWQLSAGGMSVNLDDDMMARFKYSGSARYDEAEGRYVFDTGYPRLDIVLGRLCEVEPDDLRDYASSGRVRARQ